MCEDPEVMRYLPGILTREQSEEQISKFVRHWKGRGFGLRAAEVRATGTFIGFIGLQYSEDWPEGEHKAEVGWPARPFLLETWLATEGALASLRYGFEELGLERISASRSRRT